MTKKQKRKKRNKPIHPPLTLLDKSIYIVCFVLSFLVCVILVIGLDVAQSLIAFASADTVAYYCNAGSLFALPFAIYFEISTLCFVINGFENKKPLFGNRNIPYGIYPYDKDCVPLFGRKKYTRTKKQASLRLFCLWFAILFVLACLVPLSLCGRYTLHRDNRIESVNLLNKTNAVYTTKDYAYLTIRTTYYRSTWGYSVTVEMTDGEYFTFSEDDFCDSQGVILDKMIELKSLFPAKDILFEYTENVEDVADHHDMTAAQRAKLYELFEIPL